MIYSSLIFVPTVNVNFSLCFQHDVITISYVLLFSLIQTCFSYISGSSIQTGFNSDFGYDRCKKLTSARKQMFILRSPKVLVIQLKVIDPQSFLMFLFWEKLVLVS